MSALVSPAPVSVTWDSAPVRTQYADCRIVFDGVATVGAKRYRVNASATRGARKPEIVLRHVGGAKGGQALPESQLIHVRDVIILAATLHLKPMREAVIAACREGRESEIVSAVDPAPVRLRQTRGPDGQSRLVAVDRFLSNVASIKALCAPVDPAPALAIVTGASVDGPQYLTGQGFCNDAHAALVMPMADAIEIAAREDAKEAAYRSPDNGVYQIKATPYKGPALYTLADYDRDAKEAAALDSFYGADVDLDGGRQG